jgi:hypothetical protein
MRTGRAWAAVAAAREAAGDRDVAIGGGVRIFDELPARLEILDTWPSPNATHVRYRVG